MKRREFLNAAVSGVLAATPVRVLASGREESGPPHGAHVSERLMLACQEGARAQGVAWTPQAICRLREELEDIRHVHCEQLLLSLSYALKRIRMRGGFVAPCSGSFGESLVAYLLGITTINPMTFAAHFLPYGRPDVNMAFFHVYLDHNQLPGFTRDLARESGPLEIERLNDCWPPFYYSQLGRLHLLLSLFSAPPREDGTSRLHSSISALEDAFGAFLRAYKPWGSSDLALAMRLFTPGPEGRQSWEDILLARQGETWRAHGPRSTYGHVLFQDDAVALICRTTGASKYTALSFLNFSSDPANDWAIHMHKELMCSARRSGRNPARAENVLRYLVKQRHDLFYGKAHLLSTALLLQHDRPYVRQSVLSDITNDDEASLDWAWDLVAFTRRVVR